MRRTSEIINRATKAALLTAIVLLVPARLLAFQTNNVSATKAQQSATQATTSRASISSQRIAGQRQIVVSLPDKQLALLEDGKVLKTYQIAVGAEVSRSPEG